VSGGVAVTWHPRDEPLAPAAVAAVGEAARRLAQRLLAGPPGALARLRGVASAALIVLIGEPDALPWVDGARYLGRDERAPALLLPTALAPSVPPALLERALLARAPHGPLAVLLAPPRLVGLAAARPLTSARLRAWLEGA